MYIAALLLFCSCAPVDVPSEPAVDAPVVVASSAGEEYFSAPALPSAPEAKAAEAIPAAEPIVPRRASLPLPAGKGLFLPSYENSRHKKAWYALSIAGHSGAAFDAWSTRRAISGGYGTESNPLLKPFANSNAIYPATQLGPLALDYVGYRLMSNKRRWVRRMWWVPQAAGASLSFAAGIHNVGVVH